MPKSKQKKMQKVKWLSVLAIAVIAATSFRPSYHEKEKIHWLTVAELQQAYKKEARPILFDVYTSWCGWCKVMDKDTYSKEDVVAYINEKYYAVKLDAESKDSVMLGNRKFGYNAASKTNDLASYLLFGQMAFPTTVFLSAPDARPAPLAGFLKPKELEAPLKYFGDGAYSKKDYAEFLKTFSSTW